MRRCPPDGRIRDALTRDPAGLTAFGPPYADFGSLQAVRYARIFSISRLAVLASGASETL